MKQVDAVICAVSSKQVLDQKPVIKAIKLAGCIKVIFLCFLVILETVAEILGRDSIVLSFYFVVHRQRDACGKKNRKIAQTLF